MKDETENGGKVKDRQLMVSKGYLASIVDSSEDTIMSIDLTGVVRSWNRGTERMLGYKAGEIVGRHFQMIIPEELRSEVEKKREEALKKGSVRFETQRLRKDGKRIPVDLTISVIKDRHGRVIGTSGVMKDITERKRMEEELRLLLSLTRTIGEATDFNSALEAVLRSVCETTGWSYGEAWIPSRDIISLVLTPVWYSSDAPRLKKFRQVSEGLKFPPNSGLPGRVWFTEQPEWIPDVSAVPEKVFRRASIAKEVGLKAGFGVPLIGGGEVLAVLAFYMFESCREDKRLIELVSALATQLGWVMQRKQAEDELKRSVDELEAVHEIERAVISRPDLSSLLRFIVRKARELTLADAAFYSFIDGDVIHHHTFRGIRTKAFKNIVLRKGTGLGWLAIEEKKPVVVEDFFSDERLKDAPYDAVRKEGLTSLLAVPFMSGNGKPLGVLYVANRRKTRFTKEQIRNLVTLAGQTSMAVEHARLCEEMRKAYE